MNGTWYQYMVTQEMKNLMLQIHRLMTWNPETKGIISIDLSNVHIFSCKSINRLVAVLRNI